MRDTLAREEDMEAWTPYADAIRWRRRFMASVAINVLLLAMLLYFGGPR